MAGEPYLLVFNAGSSSLKFEVFGGKLGLDSQLTGAVTGIGRPESMLRIGQDKPQGLPTLDGIGAAAAHVLRRLEDGVGDIRVSADNVTATAHRVVHGGEAFCGAVRVTAAVLDELRSLTPLAPLHNPSSLAVIEAAAGFLPNAPVIAVFDTAFFSDLPLAARSYAVPEEWERNRGVRRYGFHGLAHQYLAERLPKVIGHKGALGRVVSLHLGQGCSATALASGRPVETSMGFTPLEGLVMGTRCGDLDAGIVLHMVRSGLSWREIDDALNRRAGLLGMSGASSDVRELLELAGGGHEGAQRALAVFYHRLHKYLGAYAAVLGGVETVVFGGGIGENSPEVRTQVCNGLAWLGLELDAAANAACIGGPGRISAAASAIEVHVLPVDEESIIVREAHNVLARSRAI